MVALTWIVRPGESNDELRYSLRAAHANVANLTRVIIVGYRPSWLVNVEHVKGNPDKIKARNVWANVQTAVTHPGHPDEVVLMNDDFYVMQPTTEFPMLYRGLLDDHIASIRESWWKSSLRAAARWLEHIGARQPFLSYELHCPFPMVADDMAKAMWEARQHQPTNPPQWRTLYGNRWAVDGTQAKDAKVHKLDGTVPDDAQFVSTTDSTWRQPQVYDYLTERFPTPSPYERPRPSPFAVRARPGARSAPRRT